jgi:hypothetical protein
MVRLPFSWVADRDTRADLRYDLARELKDIEVMECPED